MKEGRRKQVFDKMLSWVFEHVKNDKELFRILHEEFGMTQDEFHDNGIDGLDYLFEAQRIDDTVGKIAVFHLIQEDGDYHFASEYNNTLYKTAKLYRRYREQGKENLTIDSIAQLYFGAQQDIDPVTFSILVDAIEHDDRINAFIVIDFDEEMLGVKDKNGVWKTYQLEDIAYASKMVERNAGKSVNAFSERMFFETLEGNEVDIITKKSEEKEAQVSEGHVSAM